MDDKTEMVGHCEMCRRRVFRYHGFASLPNGGVIHSDLKVCAMYALMEAIRTLCRELNARGRFED